ncbi:unnamed protein product [Kluyveromyces dobzhanskii CBS 2104]|uniref:WGS project CCBQ000000000 data, contig 00106 n=1 Tax=Kluyveromyces dobzhanskii CBS 2104 TaxID=1427455 RepID=A0A0A8L882_9SACH|nr:unnamed protein product [Kluyveromyces dobzhanskii CBS 2104]
MGKSKKRSRASNARANPLLRNAAKDDQLRTKRIQPLIEQLSSVVPNDRSMALGTIMVLCENPHMRSLFLKEKLVNVVTSKLLTDSNTDIVVEAYGVLRNLALEEGYDLATHIWRSNIWVNIESGFTQVQQSLQAMGSDGSKATKESKRLLFDFAENILSLLIALINGSDKILEDVVKSDKLGRVFGVLIDILKYGMVISDIKISLRTTTHLFNTVLDLIYDISSDSSEFIDKVSEHEYLSPFVENLINWEFVNDNELTKVLIQGIYLQFMDTDISYDIAASIITRVLQSIEHIDLTEVKSILSNKTEDSELIKESDEEISKKIKNYTKKRTEAMVKYQSIEISLDVVTAAIELVGAKFEETHRPLDGSISSVLTQTIPPAFSALYTDFKSRVLIGWNNLLWLYLSVGISVFELGDHWKHLWNAMQNSTEEDDFAIKIGKLSVTWALLKNVQAVFGTSGSGDFFRVVQINDEQFVKSITKVFREDTGLDYEETVEFQQRCCGVLGALACFQNQIEVNKSIGEFFIQTLSEKETKPQVLVDLINVFFEIYSDKSFDYDGPVFVALNYLSVLQTQVLPNLKNAFKFVDKNKDPQLKERCQDCLSTLDSFIAYKQNERK